MEEAYQATLDRKIYLESLGYPVVEIWECQLKREMGQNPEMRDFLPGCGAGGSSGCQGDPQGWEDQRHQTLLQVQGGGDHELRGFRLPLSIWGQMD